jgi:hypothetical protein
MDLDEISKNSKKQHGLNIEKLIMPFDFILESKDCLS